MAMIPLLFCCLPFIGGQPVESAQPAGATPVTSVLVFSKTGGFRHGSIPQGQKALKALGEKHGFRVETTEDSGRFNETELKKHQVIVFLNTTGDILDAGQQTAFEGYLRSGGGYVGIHAASDT